MLLFFELKEFSSNDEAIEYALEVYKEILSEIEKHTRTINEYTKRYTSISPYYLEEKIRDKRNLIRSLHIDASEILSNLDYFLFERRINENEKLNFKDK